MVFVMVPTQNRSRGPNRMGTKRLEREIVEGSLILLRQVINEGRRLQTDDVFGLVEARWTGQGRTVRSNGWQIWDNGDNDRHQWSEAFLVLKDVRSILNVEAVTD